MSSTSLLTFEANRGNLAAVAAAIQKNPQSVNSKGMWGQTGLHAASSGGHLDICKFLLSKSADVNCKDEVGCTPLHLACMNKSPGIEMVHTLIGAGANVNAQDSDGDTPLHTACEADRFELCECLLTNQARTDVMNNTGITVMAWATLLNRRQIIDLLRRFGAKEVPPEELAQLRLETINSSIDDKMQEGDFAGAEKMLHTALKQYPNQARLLGMLALVYENQRKMQKARETYQLAYKSDPTSSVRLINYARLLEEEPFRDLKAAEKLYLEAISLEPDNAQNVAMLGDLYESMGEPKRAKQQYRAALQLDPVNYLAQTNIARLTYNKALRDKDVNMLDSAIEMMKNMQVGSTPQQARITTNNIQQMQMAKALMQQGGESSPCSVCGKHARSRCARCTGPLYCGRECQVADWKSHKITCGKPLTNPSQLTFTK